jgi:cell division protein FtsA
MIQNDLIFALDIGTRTVIGIVGREENEKFNIVASEIVEHKSRAMMDGQVHDIEKVADAVKEVKLGLEEKLGIKLERAAIAAAGRVLRTKQVHVDTNIEASKPINDETVSSLELEGLQIAQYQLDEELMNEEKVLYYCVGYSVINYFLNGYVISNLVGHKGKNIGADLIATFLPNTVVDGLYAVMKLAGLEVSNLTLEPIAAINVAIPKDLRLLNLALVDIGAGTSDIAITKEGTVIGFDMVPVAGDEITEAICHHYIVDFKTAEKMKTAKVSFEEEFNFNDIMGNQKKITLKQIVEDIKPSIEHLANTISDKILEVNKKAPQAIFLIGGGSQVGMLGKFISEKLGMPEERVGVRKSNIIQNVNINDSMLDGPDAITPIGIAVTALSQPGYGFIKVIVNGSKIRLFNSRTLHVADAIIIAGFKPAEFIGKNGADLKFKVNGKLRKISGGLGKPAEISINESPANLQTKISNQDEITIKPAENGKAASCNILKLLADYDSDCDIYVNGRKLKDDYEIQDGDKIEIIDINLEEQEQELEQEQQQQLKQNQKSVESNKKRDSETNNYREVAADKRMETADEIGMKAETVMEVALNSIKVVINNEIVTLSGKKDKFIYVDIFDFYKFDLKTYRGKLITKLNDNPASFTEEINDGDKIEIYWQK